MDVIYLDLSESKPKLRYGLWAGGNDVIPMGDVKYTYRLFRPVEGQSEQFPSWALNAKTLDKDVLVVKNSTLHDIEFVLNRKPYRVAYESTLGIPVNIKLSEEFREYCKGAGMSTLSEFEAEYCRLFWLSYKTKVNAFTEVMNTGGTYGRNNTRI